MRGQKIIIAANTAWYVANFRLNLSRALQHAGYEVVAVAPKGPETERIEAAGVRFVHLPMDTRGLSPIADLKLLARLFLFLRRERPTAYLGYTIKPNIYGGLACRALGVPFLPNISGLGRAFQDNGLLTRLVKALYRPALRRAHRVFFQNPDDLELFVGEGLVDPDVAERLPGSGVDTEAFSPRTPQQATDTFRYLLPARLLWEKGIGEFVTACKTLRAEGRRIDCQLLGALESGQRGGVPESTIRDWQADGHLSYLGFTADVRPQLADADCVVLPSYYREGTPRSLLEAASMSKPVITTDWIGCREAVDDGVNGFLCEPRDADDLAEKMRRVMDMIPSERLEMGMRGREKMLRQFDESIVISRYLDVVKEIGG